MNSENVAVVDPVSQSDERIAAALETCAEIVDRAIPNFLRVVLNPFVAQTCVALEHFAQRIVHVPTDQSCPSFLANSVDEALSGAVKLARFNSNVSGRVLVLDTENRFPHFAFSDLADGTRIEFLPNIDRVAVINDVAGKPEDYAVLVIAGDPCALLNDPFQARWNDSAVRTIRVCSVAELPASPVAPESMADICVLDESFVNAAVPFAAFSARRELFEGWRGGKRSLFHSTTFQPNSIAALQFLKCLREREPQLFETLELDQIGRDVSRVKRAYSELFSPSLLKLVSLLGFDSLATNARGSCFEVAGQRVFDGVAGVACSVRGHNPPTFAEDVKTTIADTPDLRGTLESELARRSGLSEFVPAVSGGGAVENALKLALHVQQSRNHVIALRGGFGGKTLFALTGTSRSNYKQKIGPLYPNVTYVDPFADDAIDNLGQALRKHPVGVVQMELVQGVGGVRAIPAHVVEFLNDQRADHDYLLLVDEVQTGMFRTGPFLRSHDVGILPDLVTIGKGASDMVLPFAGTLFGERVRQGLIDVRSDLADWIRQRYDFPVAQAALLNVLRQAEKEDWTARVREQGTEFERRLREGLRGCRNVADIRVFGMLMGIELSRRGTMRLLGTRAGKLYSFAMLQHRNPLLMGFCQYEPGTFKLTPGLLMDNAEIAAVCDSICDTIRRAPLSVLASGLKALAQNRRRNS